MTSARLDNVRAIAETLANAFGPAPFPLAMAEDLGLGRQRIRTAEKYGYVQRVGRGLYIVTDAPKTRAASSLTRAQAALAPLGGIPAVIAGRLAGELHGLPFICPRSRDGEVAASEIMVPAGATLRCGYRSVDSVIRRVDAFPEDTVEISGIAVTSLLHTAIDMVRMGTRSLDRPRARALPLPEALVVLDAATHRLGANSSKEAVEMVRGLRRRFRYGPGIRTVDLCSPFINPLAENAFESWSRGYMILYGVPLPVLQQIVTGADGIDYRVDFCWPELGIIGEADGLEKYGNTPEEFRRAKSRELERQRALEAAGWIVVRWTWDELARNPGAVMRRILAAIARARTGRNRLTALTSAS